MKKSFRNSHSYIPIPNKTDAMELESPLHHPTQHRPAVQYSGLILGLRLANERRRYFVTTSLIGWAQT